MGNSKPPDRDDYRGSGRRDERGSVRRDHRGPARRDGQNIPRQNWRENDYRDGREIPRRNRQEIPSRNGREIPSRNDRGNDRRDERGAVRSIDRASGSMDGRRPVRTESRRGTDTAGRRQYIDGRRADLDDRRRTVRADGSRNARTGGFYIPERLKKRITAVLVILAMMTAVFLVFYGACAMCRACRACSDDDKQPDENISAGGSAGTPISASDDMISASDESDDTAQEPMAVPDIPDPVEQKAMQIMSEMTVEQKVGSLILIRGDKMPFSGFISTISEIHAGGAVLFRPDFDGKDKAAVQSMTAALQQAGDNHLLLCVDEEGGDVVRISFNSLLRDSRYRSPQWLYKHGGMDAIREDTAEKCGFLAELGLNVNFAPVADVVTDSSGFLYKRAFGKDAEQTAEYVGTVVGIMREHNMGCSIKHFPGYGNASGDTHEGLVKSAVTKESLYSSDLVPFIRGIESGADSVMVTHTIVSCIDSDRPCSLSPAAISLLRGELGFDGVVITDGLDMGAIQKYCGGDDPCVAAFLAGCDLMCTPDDPYDSFSKLLAAAKDGTIPSERLDASVMRILRWKIRLGLYD